MSASSSSSSPSSTLFTIAITRGRSRSMTRGEKAGLSSERSRVCSGGSIKGIACSRPGTFSAAGEPGLLAGLLLQPTLSRSTSAASSNPLMTYARYWSSQQTGSTGVLTSDRITFLRSRRPPSEIQLSQGCRGWTAAVPFLADGVPFRCGAESSEQGCHPHVDVCHNLLRPEPLDKAEVEEGHAAVLVEEIVPGMRIGVEEPERAHAAGGEPVDHLTPLVLESVPGLQSRCPAEPVCQVHGEHPLRGQLGNHFGDADEGMAPVGVSELSLVGGLCLEADLLLDTVGKLAGDGPDGNVRDVGGRGRYELEEGREQLGVGQGNPHRVPGSRVLHLHRDTTAAMQHGRMHLADRRRDERHRVELGEDLL